MFISYYSVCCQTMSKILEYIYWTAHLTYYILIRINMFCNWCNIFSAWKQQKVCELKIFMFSKECFLKIWFASGFKKSENDFKFPKLNIG